MYNSLQFSHQLVKARVQPGDWVVDATAGNGHDTLLLAQLVGSKGTVLSYDVQELALDNTKKRLVEAGCLEQVRLIHRGHETLETELYPDHYIRAAMFNTGYLPSGDHSLVTQAPSTIQALEICLRYLLPKGVITLVTYHGHPGGDTELAHLQDYLQSLDQRQFDVLEYRFINQSNQPPILFAVERKNVKGSS
jgi:ubiquinone/menaquinone biosynthesis C-methylase UbiE